MRRKSEIKREIERKEREIYIEKWKVMIMFGCSDDLSKTVSELKKLALIMLILFWQVKNQY
jgi:hypothetical protein